MKKRVNNILKGVAGAGVALGGASAFTGNDVVYATELELKEEELDELESLASESEVASETLSEEHSEARSESVVASESASTSASEVASESASVVAVSESVSLSLSESTSVVGSEYASASEVASELDAIYQSEWEEFEESGYSDQYLETLIDEIIKAQEQVKIAQQNDADKEADHDGENSYYAKADQLANLLIKYKFYQEGYVDEITYGEWDSDEYETNHVKIKYTNNGVEQIAYFDYVTADVNDNWLTGNNKDNTDLIDHIIVVQKTPEFTYYGFLGSLEVSTDIEGNVSYVLNGKSVDASKVERKYDSSGEEYYRYKGKDYKLTGFTGENNGKGVNFFSEADFNAGRDAYSTKRADVTKAEKDKDNAFSTLASMSESAAVASESNSNSVASSMNASTASSASASESASDSSSTSTKDSVASSTESSESVSTSAILSTHSMPSITLPNAA